MRINENFILRQVADTWVVLPLGDATLDFNGMLTLNESGVLLWTALEKGATREELAETLTHEYDVGIHQALADVEDFLAKLQRVGCIEA